MGMEAVGNGIAVRLETITDLVQVFGPDEIPDAINALPAAVVLPGRTDYAQTFAGACRYKFRVILLIAKQDMPSALGRVLDYADPTGSDSVLAAIRADPTLAGAADDCWVNYNTGAGVVNWSGIQYLGTEFEVEAIT